MYKPAGHTSLSPYLIVDDAGAALDFIMAVFGRGPSFVHRDDKGVIGHAEVRIDDSILMLGEMKGGATPAHIHLYVSDVDAVFARAQAAGGRVVQEPVEKGDGDRRGGITDPAGITWWLSTQITPRA